MSTTTTLNPATDQLGAKVVEGSNGLLLEIDEGGNERKQLYLDADPLVVDPRSIHRSPHVSHDGT